MAKLNDLEDVSISNPKVGDVVKYTATGWVNGADAVSGGTGGNPCGDLDGYPHKDKKETITEPWTWEVNDTCGVIVENQDGVNNLDEYARVCPGRVEIGNVNGRAELKTFDGGSTRLSAFENQLSFYDTNNQEGVTLSELVACCDGGSSGGGGTSASAFDPVAVNFPNAGVFTYQHSGRATTVDPDGTGDPDWTSTDLYNVFDRDSNSQTVDMPAGANAAVMLCAYGVTIGPWSGRKSSGTGYCNVGYNFALTSNKPNLITSPGALAASVKVYGDILGWDDGASSIAGGDETLRRKRTPSNSSSGIKMIRVYFEESTTDSPTRIIIKPDATINRIRGCEASIGSGRVLILPYHDDGTNWRPTAFLTEEDFEDDGVVEKELAERMESDDLKARMNYMSNAIRETLDYDEQLDPTGIPILEQALKDIFGLKREQINDVEYYQNRLDTIRALVMPYVGFLFGFEVNNTTRSF